MVMKPPPVVTVNEAAVIIGAPKNAIRGDITQHVISPIRAHLYGKERPVFTWEDLTCLAALYHDSLMSSPHLRKEVFRAFRVHVTAKTTNLESGLTYFVPANHVPPSRYIFSSGDAWNSAVINIRNVFAHSSAAFLFPERSHGSSCTQLVIADNSDSDSCAIRRREAWLLPLGELINVDLLPAVERIMGKAEIYSHGLDRIERDKDRMGGAPVFKKTRIPVHHIGRMYRNGAPIAEILEDYPPLTTEDVQFADLFVEANPQTGRPHKAKPRRIHDEATS